MSETTTWILMGVVKGLLYLSYAMSTFLPQPEEEAADDSAALS